MKIKEHKKSTMMSWTKEKLVEHIECLERSNKVLHGRIDNQANTIEKLFNAGKEQHWVPVSKETPNKKGAYQVTLKKDRDRCIGFGVFDLETKEWYENQNRIRTFKSAGYDVIAWKPIPDQYTKENKK